MDSQTKKKLLLEFDILFDDVLEAVNTDNAGNAYKQLIKAAAMVRGSMSQAECRRASIELILEAGKNEESSDDNATSST